MNLTTLLIFYGIFVVVTLATMYVYSYFKNKNSLSKVKQFIDRTRILNPTILKNINTCLLNVNHFKTRASPKGYSDIYLFSDFLAVLRRKKFIFNFISEPILIVDFKKQNAESELKEFQNFYADSIKFTKYKKDELVIKYTDKRYSKFRTEIILRKITEEQIEKLKQIETWQTIEKDKP